MRDHVVRTRDRRVAALLAAAAAPAERPVPGEVAALAAYRDARSVVPAPPRSRMQSRTSVKLAAASAVGVLSLVGSGYAAAATGSLPGTAQQTARDALATVSDLATTTDLEGADKGAAVSGLASDGLSKAGSRPTPTTTTSAATPAPSGTAAGSAATGADASDGRSTAGAGNADTRRP